MVRLEMRLNPTEHSVNQILMVRLENQMEFGAIPVATVAHHFRFHHDHMETHLYCHQYRQHSKLVVSHQTPQDSIMNLQIRLLIHG